MFIGEIDLINSIYKKEKSIGDTVFIPYIGKQGIVKEIIKMEQGAFDTNCLIIEFKELVSTFVKNIKTELEAHTFTDNEIICDSYCKKGYGGIFFEIIPKKESDWFNHKLEDKVILLKDYSNIILKCMKCFKEFKYEETNKNNCPYCRSHTNIVEVYDL